jgi:putative colanic acid biosynthesis glycosyltransferase
VLEKSGGKTFSEDEVLPLVQLPKADIAQAVFGTLPMHFT